MNTNYFGKGFEKYTNKNEINFTEIAVRYFSRINAQWKDDTQKDYKGNYTNNIFPNVDVNLAVKDYDEEKIEQLLARIMINNDLDEGTIESKIRHLVIDPLKMYFLDNKHLPNPFFRNSSLIEELPKEVVEEKLMKIKKSLSKDEESKVYESLINKPNNAKGENFGLALIFITGVRNNEACGLNFEDIKEFDEHKGSYYIQVYKTTEINRNTLKASGKTYNSPRNIPIPRVLYDFLIERKKYIEKNVEFPVLDQNGELVAESIEKMPIACRKDRYAIRCSSGDLSVAGKTLFSKLFKDDERTALIEYSLNHDETGMLHSEQLEEKDPTTYLLRRNMATHIRHLGFNTVQIEYYMGHKIEDLSIKRGDFCDEDFLFEVWEKLQKHPINVLANKE